MRKFYKSIFTKNFCLLVACLVTISSVNTIAFANENQPENTPITPDLGDEIIATQPLVETPMPTSETEDIMPVEEPAPEKISITLDYLDDALDTTIEVEIGVAYTVSDDPNYTDDPNDYILPQSDGYLGAWYRPVTWTSFFLPSKTVTFSSSNTVLETLAIRDVPHIDDVAVEFHQPIDGTGSYDSPYIIELGKNYQIYSNPRYYLSTFIEGSEYWRMHEDGNATSFVDDAFYGPVDNSTYELSLGRTAGYTDIESAKNNSVIISADKIGFDHLCFSYHSEARNSRSDNSVYVLVIEPIADIIVSNELNSTQYDRNLELNDYVTIEPFTSNQDNLEWEIITNNANSSATITKDGELYTGTEAGTITVKVTATEYGSTTDDAGIETVSKGSVSKTFTVNADLEPYQYSVSFEANDGSSPTVIYTNADGILPQPFPTPAAQDGYTFTGWYLDAKTTLRLYPETEIIKNSVVYAGWAEGDRYTITFETNAPSGTTFAESTPFEVTSADNTLSALPYTPNVIGADGQPKIFAGWYPNQDGTGEKLTVDTIISSDTTYFGIWLDSNTADSVNGALGWSKYVGLIDDDAQNPKITPTGDLPVKTWTTEGGEDLDASTRELQYFEGELTGVHTEIGSDIIIVLDKSTSMLNLDNSASRWNSAVDAVNELTEILFDGNTNGNDNRVALVQYSGNTRSSFNFRSSLDSFNKDFVTSPPTYNANVNGGRVSHDGTNYTTALQQALQFINSREGTDKLRPVHLVFISDGNPETDFFSNGTTITIDGVDYPLVNTGEQADPTVVVPYSRIDPVVVETLGLTGEDEAAQIRAMGINTYAIGIELQPSKYLEAIGGDNVYADVTNSELSSLMSEIGNKIVELNGKTTMTYTLPAEYEHLTIIDSTGDANETPRFETGVSLTAHPDTFNTTFGANENVDFVINGDTITFAVNSIPQEGLTFGFYAEYTPSTRPRPETPDPEPEPEPEPEPTPEPEIEVPEEPIPLEPTPEVETPSEPTPSEPTPEVEIPDEEIPLVSGGTDIPDEETPLGATPETSDTNNFMLYLVSSLSLLLVAVYNTFNKKRKSH